MQLSDAFGNVETQTLKALQDTADLVALPTWPVFGWADDRANGWLSGFGISSTGALTEVRLSYRFPDQQEQLVVQTLAAGSPAVGLSRLLQWVSRARDDDYPFEGESGNTQLMDQDPKFETRSTDVAIAEGGNVSAEMLVQPNASAWHFKTSGVTVMVAERNIRVPTLRLIAIDDLKPYLQRRNYIVTQYVRDNIERS